MKMITRNGSIVGVVTLVAVWCGPVLAVEDGAFFRDRVAPIFERRCVHCHQGEHAKGKLVLSNAAGALAGGESGSMIVPGQPDDSLLMNYISGDPPEMPKEGDPLSASEVASIRQWIVAGAVWPEGVVLKDTRFGGPWWSTQPLMKPAVPGGNSNWVRTPIDAFILETLLEHKLSPSPEADRRTLIRRLYFDLLGLPPSPDEVDEFVNDSNPQAYEKLVDRLLSSLHYGERWARHWLDVVHYGDTHGYDKDKLRPNAWPYRDYVIKAFNQDKPYTQFVLEQLAGDVLFPNLPEGIVATGFIVAGPFDYVGQIELAEGTLDKKITRNLDRDDMVSTAINTFQSMTAQCARCHDHKFDPISQEDYYSLQAVFAGIDRAERRFDADSQVAQQRSELMARQKELTDRRKQIDARIAQITGGKVEKIDAEIKRLQSLPGDRVNPAFGYHSLIEPQPDNTKWVQLDLGKNQPIGSVVIVGAHDPHAGIGAGFGFPTRFKVEMSGDPTFAAGVLVLADHTAADWPNPGVKPHNIDAGGRSARYVRISATKLTHRTNDYIFALGEVIVLSAEGSRVPVVKVTALDSIEVLPRWSRGNLIDGYYYGVRPVQPVTEIAALQQRRATLMTEKVDPATRAALDDVTGDLEEVERQLAALPPQTSAFAAATDFASERTFVPTHGKPRPVHVLKRGSEKDPRQEVGPGTASYLPDLLSRFELAPDAPEGERRAALARWIVDRRNPLTWRSIVNRVWQYHFGRGLVDSPSDFGRMGSPPTHPRLLDWLAADFRDGPRSLKQLHRLIVTSAVYRQSSAGNADYEKIDGGNQYLWRMSRRRLDAEAIRDAVLSVSGKLDRTMSGPGFWLFGFKDDPSPHYMYEKHDPDDPKSHRRSIYRFIVRSVPDPFMTTLDCADSSLAVPKRNETLTALQSLAMLNNHFMVRMAEHFAARAKPLGSDTRSRVTAAWRLALAREPSPEELQTLTTYADKHGLANACRLIFNTNEFVFVD